MNGPEYAPDRSTSWKNAGDLPKAEVRLEVREFEYLPCPRCGTPAVRLRTVDRLIHDIGDISNGTPQDIHFRYTQHRCKPCNLYFHAEFPSWVLARLHYTRSVVETAVRIVVEDGLPYDSASWHMWRDHCVFVPAGTIQNWVEASGKKSGDFGDERVSRQRVFRLLRLHRRR